MKLHELVTDKVYKAQEKEPWLRRTIYLKFQEVTWDDGESMLVGINLATGLKVNMFAAEWTLQELSPLEQELL